MIEEQRAFVEDARDLLAKLNRDLEMLHVARFEGRRRRQLAAQIFRRVHTLKGSAGSFRFKSANRIAHEFEGVLDGIRLGRVHLTDAVLDTFDDALDALSSSFRIDAAGQSDKDFDSIIRRLRTLATQQRSLGVIAGSLRDALPPDIATSLSEYDLQHAREAIREGARLFVVSAIFQIDSFDQNFRQLTKLLGQSGELITTLPGEAPADDEIGFRLLYATELISAELRNQAAALGRIAETEISVQREAATEVRKTRSENFTALVEPTIGDTPVRVELKQVDELISAAGDLFRQTQKTLETFSSQVDKRMIDRLVQDLRPRFLELEERLMKLRLFPVGEILERTAARAGRTAARQLGKEVEFEIIGSYVGIEKGLVEVIADPLLHLVRNAITHGIELPDERRAAGKNPTGKVRLAAANHCGRLHITVTDDGRGIDIDRIIAAAAQQGISNVGLSVDQCLRLIFRPGFSTSRDVSDLSGRGIGLDIVDRAMEVAGGEVRVVTQRGIGTTFAMIVPAMLSMVRCLLVRCGEQLYAIDAAYAMAIGSQDTINEETPLLYLSALAGLSSASPTTGGNLILWRSPNSVVAKSNGARTYRIAVDEIIARQDTLVRSLGRHAPRWPGVCGAAEMFDGRVALVLDLEELIKDSANDT